MNQSKLLFLIALTAGLIAHPLSTARAIKPVSPIASDTVATKLADASTSKPTEAATKLADGLYLVTRVAPERQAVDPVKDPERLLVNDYHFLEPSERDKLEFVVIDSSQFVPMVLHAGPEKSIDGRGKPMLHLQLAEDQVTPLEKFTTKNSGGRVAIVIGGEIVTMHKIREPIKGGKLQITRCTDNGCEAIYSQLQSKQSKTE